MFDVDIEICDEEKMYKEYVNIYERFKPSNAQIVYDMKNDVNVRKKQLIEEFDFYVKKKYGLDITITDRL
jgi:hypothetical protein